MYLSNIKIRNFKNLNRLDINCQNNITYFYSPNGTGKTNLLEAIQCLTVGKSLRSKSENDIFNFDKKNGKVLVSGNINDEDEIKSKHEYILSNTPKRIKELKINNNKVSINSFIGRSPSIWFSPESIKIINTSALNKRKYFDDILVQLYPEYFFNLKSYNRSLKQRNKILQNDKIDKSSIRVWTEELINFGSKLVKQRQSFYKLLNDEFDKLNEIERYKFKILPEPSIKLNDLFDEDANYRFLNDLQNNYKKDLEMRSTTVGPHKDNWQILIKIKPKKEYIHADRFASRGQQRMSLIVLQLVLINIFIKQKSVTPIMLLDDIFSELDNQNEKILIEFLTHNKIQTFITGVNKLKDKKINQIDLSSRMKQSGILGSGPSCSTKLKTTEERDSGTRPD